jgi:hypothetical protein
MPATAAEGERQGQKARQEPRSGPGRQAGVTDSFEGSAEREAPQEAAARLGAQWAQGATAMGSSFPAMTPSFLPEPGQLFFAWYMEMIWQMWAAYAAFWMSYFENMGQFAEERRKLHAQTYEQAKSNPAAVINPADFAETYRKWMAAASSRSAAMPFPPPFMTPPGMAFPWPVPPAPAAGE